jgi:hypothetical protein
MAEVGTQVYLGGVEIVSNALLLGNDNILINSFDSTPAPPAPPATIPQAGLQFWLDPTTYTTSGSKWLAKQGNATGSFTGSYIYSGSTFFNMNTASLCNFNTTSSLNYGFLAQPNTLFVVGRSSGSVDDRHGRLIGGNNNWLMGTYGGGPGAGSPLQRAYYDGTFVISDTPYDTLWRVYTAVWQNSSSASFFVNGQWVAESTAAGQYAFDNFSINNGAYQGAGGAEATAADYGDIILYDRVLTKAEITEVYDAIKSKYGL